MLFIMQCVLHTFTKVDANPRSQPLAQESELRRLCSRHFSTLMMFPSLPLSFRPGAGLLEWRQIFSLQLFAVAVSVFHLPWSA